MEDAPRDDDDEASYRRAAAYALSLLEIYGPSCQALTEEHLDQAIEQEVNRNTNHREHVMKLIRRRLYLLLRSTYYVWWP